MNKTLIGLIILFLGGCSSLRKVAIKSSSPLFVEGSDKVTLERDWEFFRESAPGNLKFLEMIYLQDTSNMELLATLTKAYAGYAYAVPETLALADDLAGIQDSVYRRQAISMYTRALDYGLNYLAQKGLQRKELLELTDENKANILGKKLNVHDLTAAFFTAQAWASLITLQRDNMALVAHVPRVKVMLDWICEKNPEIENGACEIFLAQYEAMKPKVMGGKPELAKQLYENAMTKRPQHLIIRLGYVQYLVVPSLNEEEFRKQLAILKLEISKWDDLNRDSLEDNSDYKGNEHLNIFNAIAKKRMEIFEKYQSKIF